jgi:phosphoglucosamine mutase
MSSKRLFGTDGVRGKAGDFLSPQLAMRLAMAAGIYFRKHSKTNKILLGKDTRISGYMIENALVAGFTAVGYNVVQIGPMPTPAIAFITESMRCDAGIMLSASHNPYYDNGIKFFNHLGDKLDESAELEIEKIYYNKDELNSHLKNNKEIGRSKRIDDVIGRYIIQLKNSFALDMTLKGLRIVVDTANGAAYKVAPTVFDELGADVIVLNNTPDGYNINENCGALHPNRLAKSVLDYRADLGIALDGDADRLVVVDERGEVVDGDKLIGALGVFLKSMDRLKSDGVVATVMSNLALEEYLLSNNLKLYRSDVGDKHVLSLMKEKNINFGGEQSGHIIYLDVAKTGDGLASALQVLSLMISSGKKASEVLSPFELYPQILKNIEVSSKPPLKSIDGLDLLLKTIEKEGIRHLIRYSGTENKLRLLLEGKSKAKLDKYIDELSLFFKAKLS